jgi:hypothetical protein
MAIGIGNLNEEYNRIEGPYYCAYEQGKGGMFIT